MVVVRNGRRRRWFARFERVLLGAAMTVLAAAVERVLARAIRKGAKPAPRTAAETGEGPNVRVEPDPATR